MLICRSMPRTASLIRVLWGGVALGLLFYLALTLWLAYSGIFFPYQLDYGEGIVLWFTHELAVGHSIYKGLEGLPYASSNYPPLGFVLALPFRTVFGDTYIGGRWLNLAAALVSASFLYRIARVERGRRAAALGALFFLGSTFVYHWVPLFRVDLIGLSFTAAGIFFVWRWQTVVDDRRIRSRPSGGTTRTVLRWPYLAAAALLFLAAFYTKHSLVAAPAAALVATGTRDRRAAVGFGLSLGLIGGAVFLVLNQLSAGGFAFGLVTSNATVWLWSTFLATLNDFLWTYLVLIAFSLWALVIRVRKGQVGVLEIFAVAAPAALVSAGRVGAWENYYLEAVFVVCLFAGIAFVPLLNRMPAGPWWLPVLLLIQLALFWREHEPSIAVNLMQVTTRGNLDLAPLVRAQQGTIISEDMGLLVTNGKPVDYYTFQYSSLARSGQWDQHWELDNLRAGGFPLVILNQGTREDVDHFRDFTRDFLSALDLGYRLKLEDERYKAYIPMPLAHMTQVDLSGKLGLVGWSLEPSEAPQLGQTMILTCVWRAETQLAKRYTEFAHLEDAGGGVVAQDDHEPRVGTIPDIQLYPTTNWGAGEMVRDHFTLHIPADLKPGSYSLRVGWYDSVTQDPLSAQDGAASIELTKLQVSK